MMGWDEVKSITTSCDPWFCFLPHPVDEEGVGDSPGPQCHLHHVPHHGGKVLTLVQTLCSMRPSLWIIAEHALLWCISDSLQPPTGCTWRMHRCWGGLCSLLEWHSGVHTDSPPSKTHRHLFCHLFTRYYTSTCIYSDFQVDRFSYKLASQCFVLMKIEKSWFFGAMSIFKILFGRSHCVMLLISFLKVPY